MGKPRRRKTTNAPSPEPETTTGNAITDYDDYNDNVLDFNKINVKDIINSSAYRTFLLQLHHPHLKIAWEESPSPSEEVEHERGPEKNIPQNKTHNGKIYHEHFPISLGAGGDTSSFVDDGHRAGAGELSPPARVPPPRRHDVSPHPPIWHSVHQSRAPFITFWPVGILMMAVFIIGFVSLVLCRVMATSRPTYHRRIIRPINRPAVPSRSNASDDDGGFAARSERQTNYSGGGASDPPRAATPPPPYPGSPPGASVYVNPLDVKTCHLYVPSVHTSPRRRCNLSPVPDDQELPPPYPGTWTANQNPQLSIQSRSTTLSLQTSLTIPVANPTSTAHTQTSTSTTPVQDPTGLTEPNIQTDSNVIENHLGEGLKTSQDSTTSLDASNLNKLTPKADSSSKLHARIAKDSKCSQVSTLSSNSLNKRNAMKKLVKTSCTHPGVHRGLSTESSNENSSANDASHSAKAPPVVCAISGFKPVQTRTIGVDSNDDEDESSVVQEVSAEDSCQVLNSRSKSSKDVSHCTGSTTDG